jgi:hypothetical protein
MFDNEKCGTKPIVYSGSVQSLAFILLTIICIPSTLCWQLCCIFVSYPFDTFKLIDNPYKIKRNLTLRQMETFLTVLHTLIYQIPHI